jgi:ParB family chromosome partitioning protein
MEVKEIKLSEIHISGSNTRKDLEAGTEDGSLDDLANSIKERGLLNPITVMKRPDGSYDLIVGQRRFLACKKLGMEKIPAIVREKMEDTDATIISLIENVHRADMSPIDKAKAYKKIHEKYRDYNKVAKETGISVSTIKKYINLLNLAPSIQAKMSTNEGPAGIGTLSKLAEAFISPEDQEKVLGEIGGFKQNIQLEIIKRSDGNPNKLAKLKEEAMEGAFDAKMCAEGLCFRMPEELKVQIRELLDKKHDIKSLRDIIKSMK